VRLLSIRADTGVEVELVAAQPPGLLQQPVQQCPGVALAPEAGPGREVVDVDGVAPGEEVGRPEAGGGHRLGIVLDEGGDQPVALGALEVVDPRHELGFGADPRPQLEHRPVGERGFLRLQLADRHEAEFYAGLVTATLPGAGSISWRVNREAALLLGGGRALLMQVAHPKVAAGVDEHSDFQDDPLRRLNRTLELSLALSFGTGEEVRAAARQINRTHERVTGAGYQALDPELLLWVHATLIDSALLTYRTFVRRLDRIDAEAYYQEAKPIGALLGIPAARFPATLDDFDTYVADMLAGPVQPDQTSRRLARLVLRPPIRRVPRMVFAPVEAITAGLLPEGLRRAYGLPWGRPSRFVFTAARSTVPRLLAALPEVLRVLPPARLAESRALA
jgi:uncharacterized protein (DUF2236 family)